MTSNSEQHDTDEDEIPLLEDVVMPDELEPDSATVSFAEQEPESAESQTPEYDVVLLAMRDEITSQLQRELQPIVAEALQHAIAETTERLAQILHDELDSTLERRIRGLIDQHMESEFGPREQHLRDEDEG